MGDLDFEIVGRALPYLAGGLQYTVQLTLVAAAGVTALPEFLAVAVDGMDGWNALRESKFDLVVSDVDMPRMTGLELVTQVRADTRLREIPVIIVSYKDREEDRLRGLEVGADRYMTKNSFHDASFLEAVSELIGRPA